MGNINDSLLNCTTVCKATLLKMMEGLTVGASEKTAHDLERGAFHAVYHSRDLKVIYTEKNVNNPKFELFKDVFHQGGQSNGETEGFMVMINRSPQDTLTQYIPERLGEYFGTVYAFMDFLEKESITTTA